MDGWSGHLLIAPAWMSDPSFSQAIVLLIDHDPRGAFGLVINRPSSAAAAEVWREATGKPCEAVGPLFVGGPVSGPLIALHDREEDGDRPVVPGLYATTTPDRLARLLEHPPLRLRLFAGYAGWGRSQLDRELQDAAWVVVPARAEDAFLPGGAAPWHAALRRATAPLSNPLADPLSDPLSDPLADPHAPPGAAPRSDLN